LEGELLLYLSRDLVQARQMVAEAVGFTTPSAQTCP